MNQQQLPPDARFNPQLSHYAYRDDEISLVDLAKTLVKRWRLMVMVFFITFVVALTYALSISNKYEYITVYHMAEASIDSPLESVAGVVAKINNIYIPNQIREFLVQQHLTSLPFKLEVTNPKDSHLLIITSQAIEENQSLVTQLHTRIVEQLKIAQDAEVKRRITLLQTQIDETTSQLNLTKNADSSKIDEPVISLINTIGELKLEISHLKQGDISAIASQSLEFKGTNKKLVLALGIMLGVMLAIIAVFIREFASQVCLSLKEEKTES